MDEVYLDFDSEIYSWQCYCGVYHNDETEEKEIVKCKVCGKEYRTVLCD